MPESSTCPRETPRSRTRRARLDEHEYRFDEIEHRLDRAEALLALVVERLDEPARERVKKSR